MKISLPGLFSPLEGFNGREDYESILYNKRLSNGLPWTLPIVLDTDNKDIKEGDEILLKNDANLVAVMQVEEIYNYDKRAFAEQVYGTNDAAHPGVAKTYSMKDTLLGGKISLINESETPYFKYAMKPAGDKESFQGKRLGKSSRVPDTGMLRILAMNTSRNQRLRWLTGFS